MAGGGSSFGDGGAATAGQLNTPNGVALDGSGNLYIADWGNERIRKVDSSGNISTVAGNGTFGFSGDGGAATAARLASPSGVALDALGNLYIADTDNQRIRKVDTSGNISTVAGTGTAGFSGDGGAATAARLRSPSGVALDGSGNLYVADRLNNRIRKVDSSGNISTVAGSGTAGFGGDGGSATATAARLRSPAGVTLDGSGNLYIADTSNHRIRKVDSSGVITTVAGGGSSLGDGGAATAARLRSPSGVALDGSGNLYIADRDNYRIRKVDSSGNISTVAGSARGFSGDGAAATAAQLNGPEDVALDGSGNLYIADTGNNRIRKVARAQSADDRTIETVAGTGTDGYSGEGGLATAAQLNAPRGVALDDRGNLYIADTNNNRIRWMEPHSGNIFTEAGNGTAGFSGDGGPAGAAQLNQPHGVALDGSGNLYIADTNNHRIRKVYQRAYQRVITTVAGTGTAGYSGDGGAATAARLNSPSGVAVDGAGNLYIADRFNHRIRKVDSSGNISTVAGTGTAGFGGDGGSATDTAAQLNQPQDVALDGAGNLYIADRFNHRIRKVDTSGNISTVAGSARGFSGDGAAATSAALRSPWDVAVDGSGNLYIADRGNQRIRKVDSAGVITTVAGTGTRSFGGDGSAAVAAQLNGPQGVALDGAGNLYIADTGNNRIRKVARAQSADDWVIETVAGGVIFSGDGAAATAARLSKPNDVAVDGAGNLYIADRRNNRIRKVTSSSGNISTVAGTGTAGFGGDGGAATAAQLNYPAGVALDGAGNLYIADRSNQRIRKVDSAGNISTVAGDGTAGFSGDGAAATEAQLNWPSGVALDGAGNLYIADTINHRIRKVDSSGNISTVAGGGSSGLGDGSTAVAARLLWPRDVAVDGSGNLYIADYWNQRIRKVDSAGVITTVAGTGAFGYSRDGAAATAAQLNYPSGVALDGAGNLYIADSNNQRIRKVDTAGGDHHGGGYRHLRLRRGRRRGHGGSTEHPHRRGAGRVGQPVHRRYLQPAHPQGGLLGEYLHRGGRIDRNRRHGH